MRMQINTSEAGDFRVKLEGFGHSLVDRRLLIRLGFFAKTRILQRTAQGKGHDGQREITFRPYSKSYAKQRSEAGRSTSKVNLFFYGKMLGAITTKAEPVLGRTTLFFADPLQAAKAHGHHYGHKRLKARPFFAIGTHPQSKDQREMREIIAEHIEERKGANGIK